MTEVIEDKRQGFTQIDNDVLEAVARCKFNGSQIRILLIIWRYTYGFQRSDHEFSLTYFRDNTGLSESAIKKELKLLLDMNVITETKKPTTTTPRRLAFNSNYLKWLVEDASLVGLQEGHNSNPPNECEGHNSNSGEGYNCNSGGSHNSTTHEGHNSDSIEIKGLNKQIKESVKENIYSSFEQFYSIYPRKVSKEQARKAWIKLAKDKSFNADLIINNTLNFAETCKELNQDTKFIPYPATYLNQKRYEDYEVINPEGINIASGGQGSSLAEKNKQLLREIGGDLFSEDRGREEVIPDYYELLPEV